MLAFSIIGLIAAGFGLGFATALLNGWVLTKLWAWFIVSAFGAPPLSLGIACGIALIAHALTCQDDSRYAKKEDDKSTVAKFVETCVIQSLRPLLLLLCGLIYKQFI